MIVLRGALNPPQAPYGQSWVPLPMLSKATMAYIATPIPMPRGTKVVIRVEAVSVPVMSALTNSLTTTKITTPRAMFLRAVLMSS